MTIKEIFDTISKKESHEFKLYESYTPKTEFYVLDENGEKVKVVGMVIKEEPILKIITDKATFRVADEHSMMGENSQKWVKELKVGDKLPMKDGFATITAIEKDGTELVYDLAVDSKTHLYQDEDGFIHHNTFHVEKTMKEMLGTSEGRDAKWRHRKGAKLSPFGLYLDLFINRDDMTIVYDDSDSVWKDPDSVNILKSALDTYKERDIAWTSRATTNVEIMTDEERELYYSKLYDALANSPEDVGTKIKLPSTFKFTSRIIFISNLKPDKIDSAIRSRSLFMDIYLTREDVVKRIISILPFVEPDVPMEEKLEVLESLQASSKELTMRAVTAGIAVKAGGFSDWQRLVEEYS